MTDETPALDALALDLVRASARLTRTASRIPGVSYSSIAWRVLADLERHGATRVSELAAAQRVAQPTMTSLLLRLAGEGWVERGSDPEDGRATLVTVTDEGVRALAEYRAGAAALIAPHLAGLEAEDLAALHRAAALMLHLADAA